MQKRPQLSPSEMTADQRECYKLLCDLVGGEHHLQGIVREFGKGIIVHMRNTPLATFDFSRLTCLVLMAHDRCIRAEIEPSGPRMIGLSLFKRHARTGALYERHPTMEEHIQLLRKQP